MSTEERRLAAIVFTDICGFTELMGRDETRAMALLDQQRALLKPIISNFNGEWLKEIGDGVLISFPSAVMAVTCSLEIQRILAHNSDLTLRIGIHIGDVIKKGGDVFGDGVNIASRLEPLAEPGGICVSERVHEDIKNKPEISTAFQEEQLLKGVDKPIKVYSIFTQMGTAPAPDMEIPIQQPAKSKMPYIAAGIVAGLLITIFALRTTEEPELTVERAFYTGERIPVAIADFENNTGDVTLDGLSGLLITSLEQSNYLTVLTRSRMYDLLKQIGKAEVELVDEKIGREICHRANINALVLTSIRQFGELYSVDLKILDIEKDEYLFSTNVQAEGKKNIPGLIDEISKQTRISLAEKAEEISSAQTNVADMTTNNLDAYQYYFEGNELMFKLEFDKAIEKFQKAVKIDPTFASAYARLTYALRWNSLPGWEEARDKARQYIKKAPKKDQYFIRALDAKRIDEIAIYEQMLDLYPDEKIALFEIGDVYYHNGNIKGSISYFKKVLELDPSFEFALQHITWAHRDIEDTKGMVRYAKLHVGHNNSERNYRDLIWAYSSDGQFDKAIETYDHAISLFPRSSSLTTWGISQWKGKILNLTGKYNEAEHAFRSLIDPINSKKNTAVGYNGLFWHYMLMGQFEKTEKYIEPFYNIMMELDDKMRLADDLSQMAYGILVLQKNESKASEIIMKIEALNSPSGRLNRFMCTNYALMGNQEKALSFSDGVYEKKELVDAFVAMSENQYKDALKYLIKREKTMTSFHKDNIRFQIAMCYINLDQFNKAEKYLQGILAIKGDDTSFENTLYPVTNYWLGVCNEELGKDDQAILHYKQLLDYWKNADSTIPELIDTKKRLANLKLTS